MYNLVSFGQINGYLVLLVIQEAKVGIVYSAPGWDIKLQTILKMASHFRTGYGTPLLFRREPLPTEDEIIRTELERLGVFDDD